MDASSRVPSGSIGKVYLFQSEYSYKDQSPFVGQPRVLNRGEEGY